MKLFFALSLLLALCSANAAETKLPDLSGVTDGGLKIEIYSELSPLSINQIHSWQLRVLDDNNRALELEELLVIGGMPEHDHGLPTQPQLTGRLDNGDYLLEGLRFHMQGLWQIHIEMQVNGLVDTAIIEFKLQ
tara:strand:+ start:1990 stop:2391 length:402 start_codon:yes stop_codon:yes gene_type:complete